MKKLNKILINCKKSKQGFFNFFDSDEKIYINLDLIKWGIKFGFLDKEHILKKSLLFHHISYYYYFSKTYSGYYVFFYVNKIELKNKFFIYLKN